MTRKKLISLPAALLFFLAAEAAPPERIHSKPLAPDYQINPDGTVSLTVCYNASCAAQKRLRFDNNDLKYVKTQIQSCRIAPGEHTTHKHLQQLRIGVWQMESLARKYHPPLANDLPVNDQEFGIEGRTDCVDNATNTTTFINVLIDLGYLNDWHVVKPAVRKPLDINRVHWTAVVSDVNNRQWSVDSWFRRHGHLPFVMPLNNWRREELAWKGEHQRFNPYPKTVPELCD
ncbi:MAG: hypothetical protein AAF387_20335 [Pseudomonadota bacterium]